MKVYELFSEITKWCKGSEAEYESGSSCNAGSERAVKWCSIGGIKKCYSGECQSEAIMIVGRAIARKRGIPLPEERYDAIDLIVGWNDAKDRKAEEVVELFKSENV